MAPRVTIRAIKEADRKWKPGTFAEDAIMLASLADNRGRAIMLNHLQRVGMGDKENTRPLCVGVIPRLAESLSVLYRAPATRRLKRKREILPDSDPQSETFAELSQRALLDSVWSLVDYRRNLTRQCVLSFVESHAQQSVQARVFWPFEVFRMVSPAAADVLEEDEAIALQVLDSPREEECVYQLWEREGTTWRMWIVNGADSLHGPQPYGESGAVPFAELPILLVYDSLPAGAPWLAIPESRLDFALNVNALVNDLAYLVKLEAHSLKVAITDDPAAVRPTAVGPDRVWWMPGGSQVQVLSHNPQILGVNETVAAQLAMLALSESLPTDIFERKRTIHTGPALKAAERDLEARRQRQAPLAVETERRAFRKLRAIHNVFAREWGMDELAEDVSLVASFGRQWQPIDPKELQETWFKDLAVGAGSIIGYLQDRYNLDRQGAIDLYRQVQADRAAYPVRGGQNPGAMLDGPLPALGEGGSTLDAKTPGAFNPDIATSTEGASVTDAVATRLEGDGPDLADGNPTVVDVQVAEPDAGGAATKVQDTLPNGAQIHEGAAVVASIAAKAISRISGVRQFAYFFGLKEAQADHIVADVGETFFAEEPPAPTPFGGDGRLVDKAEPDPVEPPEAPTP